MASQTKADILAGHDANEALNTQLLPPVARRSRDLSADGLRSFLDERIIAASSEALEAGQTHYVDVPGIAPLRAAIANYLGASAGASYEAGNIIVTAGVQESRFLTIQMIGAEFESIAVPTVAHPGVRKALGVRERTVIPLAADVEGGYLPAVDAIAGALAAGCRLLYLESPARLSGAAYADEDAAAISRLLNEYDAMAIWDQGLAPWVDGKYNSLASFEESPSLVTSIGEAFPGMGLASWHIGYIAAPEAHVPAMQSQKQIMAICTSTAAQYAALEASAIFAEAHNRQLAHLSQLRSDLIELARAVNLEVIAGSAANVLALRASQDTIANLNQAGFEVADGALFGAPAVIRLSVSAAAADALQALR
ncbi:MAG: pyridoxal phosphate-dependent aminotransferase [Chloroflexi bacterium]|nr:pyridoxal phosphate-dependent aminotransferase [Chloroflexota bacterium]